MAFPIGPALTTDQYPGDNAQGAAILVVGTACWRVDIIVIGSDVFYSLRGTEDGVSGGTWDADTYLPGGPNQTTFVSLDRVCSGIKLRSATPGTPAKVAAVLVPPGQLPPTAS